jgi:hypothetical protein
MRHFLHSVQLTNLVEGVNAWRETTMETEDLAFNHCSQGQVIEELGELLPHVSIPVFPEAFIVETISKRLSLGAYT